MNIKTGAANLQKAKPVHTINTDDKELLRQQMNEKMDTEASKEIYKKRKVIVEPVFGQIKNTGFRGFNLRGHEKTSGQFSLVCIAHNIRKIMKTIFKGVVRFAIGKIGANGSIMVAYGPIFYLKGYFC